MSVVLKHHYESEVTEPTCTEKGFITYTCTRCGDIYTDDRTVYDNAVFSRSLAQIARQVMLSETESAEAKAYFRNKTLDYV